MIERFIPDKPVYVELRQQVRRFFSGTNRNGAVAIAIVIVAVLMVFVFIAAQSAYSFPVGVLALFLPGVIGLILPPILSGVISGEVQGRSLEALLAAPVTSMDIVKAKTLRAAVPTVLITIVVLMIAAIFGIAKLFTGSDMNDAMNPAIVALGVGVLVSFIFAYSIAGLIVGVSAVARSRVAGLIGSYGLLFALYAILPGVIAPLAATIGNDLVLGYILAFHPYAMVVYGVFSDTTMNLSSASLVVCAVASLAIHLVLGWLGMAFAANRIEMLRKKGVSTVG